MYLGLSLSLFFLKSKFFLRKMRLKGSGCWLWFLSISPKLSACGRASWGGKVAITVQLLHGLSTGASPALPRAVIRHPREILHPVFFVTPSITRSWFLCDNARGLRRLGGHYPGKQLWVRSFGSYTTPHDKMYQEICYYLTKKDIKMVIFKGFPLSKSHLQENSTYLKISLTEVLQ